MKKYYLFIAITFFSILGQHPLLHELMIWDLNLIKSGDYWRIITSSFTHTNKNHLLINLMTVWALPFAFKANKVSVGVVLYLSFSVGFILCFIPSYEKITYAGLSGMIYGLIIIMSFNLEKKIGLIVTFFVFLKLIIESKYGSSTMLLEMIDAKISLESHLIGVISALLYLLLKKRKP